MIWHWWWIRTINGDGWTDHEMSWPTTRPAGRSWDQLRTDNGGKGYAYDHICAAAKWYYLATANSIAMILLCNDCTLPLPAAATAQSIPACFLIPSLHSYHQFWLLMVSPIICKKAELYVMMMMNYLWMIIDRHGRDELKPLSLFTSACRIKQTVKFSHRKCFFFFFYCISLNLDLFHIPQFLKGFFLNHLQGRIKQTVWFSHSHAFFFFTLFLWTLISSTYVSVLITFFQIICKVP